MKFLSLLALLPVLVAAQATTETTSAPVPTTTVDPLTVTGDLGDAAVIEGNPENVTYVAEFKGEGKINGNILFHAGKDGEGVHVAVDLKGFPAGGPFAYHIHDQPVPADGNCTRTLAHLDPYIRRGTPPCNPEAPATCEVGDLAGKHGKVAQNATTYKTDYNDAYLSLKSPSGAFIGNRSVVIHDATSARIACVNITLKEHGHGGPIPTQSPTDSPTEPPAPNPTSPPDSGAAKLATGALAGLVVALAAAFAL